MATPRKTVPKVTGVRLNGAKVEIRKSSVEAVINYIYANPRQSVDMIAYGTDVSRGTINAILEAIPEGRKVVAEGKVAVMARGPRPKWAKRAPNMADLPTVETRALVPIGAGLPEKITNELAVTDYEEGMEIVRAFVSSTNRSPKGQKRMLAQFSEWLKATTSHIQEYADDFSEANRALAVTKQQLDTSQKLNERYAELLAQFEGKPALPPPPAQRTRRERAMEAA